MTTSPSFSLSLSDLQPSQLYISSQKLARVQETFNPTRPETLPPIPIKKLNGRLIYTDGHTRALAAWLSGLTEIPVAWDPDDLDWEAYQTCVDWCLAEGIRTIADLQKRIINPEEYQHLWLDRCQKMQSDLQATRSKQSP